jgi:uncharacterized damage-inducible protein DinB
MPCRLSVGAVACSVFLLLAAALQAQNPVADAVRGQAVRATRNLVGAAEEMPAEKYRFRPTSGQMSFGQLVLHVARSNRFMCSAISGMAAPQAPTPVPTAPKPELVASLKGSFDFCRSALAGVTDAGLSDSVPFFERRKVTRAAALVELAADWADHYGQAAGYLRLNGLLPPTAKRGEM